MNWTKSIYMLLAGAILMVGTSACSIKTRIKRADRKFAIGEYYDAAEIYRNCYGRISAKSERSLKARVAFNQGECYRILNSPKAVKSYQNAVRYKYQDSIAYLRLAQVLHYQGKYRDAEKNYTIYLEGHPNSDVAKYGIYACRQIEQWKKQPSRYRVHAAKDFNYKKSGNFAPAFIGEDGDALMFTSNRKIQNSNDKKTLKRPSPVTGQPTYNLFTTKKDASGKWKEIELPDGIYGESESEENSNENDSTQQDKNAIAAELGACCFTADGKTMYFTYSKPINGQDLGAKIFRSDRAGGEWGEPQEVKLFQDSSITVGHPAVTANGDTLYFVSDAPGGFGGKDIWRAEEEEGQWINITNMGPQINTGTDELYPSVRRGGVLYFSSTGLPGYGGLDIFMARPTGRDTIYDDVSENRIAIYQVQNMGLPLNSNGDDFGITFEGNKEEGYFSSNRGQAKGLDQIYHFVLPEIVFAVEGKVADNNGDPLSEGIIRLVGDDGTNVKMQIRRDGTYRLKLKKNVRYVMLATSRGHLNQKQTLTTEGLEASHTYQQDFALAPISKPITMNNVFYETGRWELTENSSEELMHLVKMLEDNPNITIELGAHTDRVGDDASNKTLSEKRAQACVNFLIKAGIEKDRLTAVGYGETHPVVADEALHNQYRFIPTGQELNETFVLTLTKEQQEICNQLNRRTEFRVLKTTYKLY